MMTGRKLLFIMDALTRMDEDRLARAFAARPWLLPLLKRLSRLCGRPRCAAPDGTFPAQVIQQARAAHLDTLLKLDHLTRMPSALVLGLARTTPQFEPASYWPTTNNLQLRRLPS